MKNTRKKTRTIFLTGATGLVGSYMLKILLKNGHKVFVLAQNKNGKSAKERVKEVVCFWDKNVYKKHYRKLVVLEGNIVKRNLGLDEKTLNVLRNEVEEVFHSAANTKFNLPLEEARKINVEGTENVLKLAYGWNKKGKLLKANHISTAYVCGDHKGVFSEKNFDVGQSFGNTYTKTKFEAEKVAEGYRKKSLWVDIFRLPLMIGEKSTGKTFSFSQALYHLVHIWTREIFEYFPIKGSYMKVDFVDEICKSLNIIIVEANTKNKTYHVFRSDKMPIVNLLNISAEYVGFKMPKIISKKDFLNNNNSIIQKKILENNIFTYNDKVRLVSGKTNAFLLKSGFKFSTITQVDVLKLLSYCIKTNFIKKR